MCLRYLCNTNNNQLIPFSNFIALKILYLTSRFPYPLEKGDKLRAFYQIAALSEDHDIHLVSITDEDQNYKNLEKLRHITQSLHIIRISPLERYFSLFSALLKGLPFQIAWFYSQSCQKIIEKLVEEIKPDHIFCQLPRMAEYCIHLPFPKTLDYMDSFGVGMIRRATVANGLTAKIYEFEAKRMINYEAAIAKKFDHLTIISHQDKAQFQFPEAAAIHVVSNGISPDFFNFPKYDKPEYDIVFVGNMNYLPNIEAAEYLVTKILPNLDSNCKVLIAGASPSARIKRLASQTVVISGWMDDIRHAYANAKIFVAPIWSGTGQQNKILEAMAMGLPCITTAVVNNAIGAAINKEILLAETPEEFTLQINQILSNETLYHQISAHSTTFVQQNFDWKQNGKLLSTIFAQNLNIPTHA
jgi:polysaccharide biosynthesis protein PslH